MRRLIKHSIQKYLIDSTRLEQCEITLLFRMQVVKVNELTGTGCFHAVLMKTEFSLGANIASLAPDKSSSTSRAAFLENIGIDFIFGEYVGQTATLINLATTTLQYNRSNLRMLLYRRSNCSGNANIQIAANAKTLLIFTQG